MDACAIQEGRMSARRAMQAALTAGLIACCVGAPRPCVAAAPGQIVYRHLDGSEFERAEAACTHHVADLTARTGMHHVATGQPESTSDGLGLRCRWEDRDGAHEQVVATALQRAAPAPQAHGMLKRLPEAVGWIAAGLTLLTFYCTQAQRLRMFALSANLAFILYGFLAALWPVLFLHLLLLPINLVRLRSALRESAAGMARSAPSARAQEPWFKQSGKRLGS